LTAVVQRVNEIGANVLVIHAAASISTKVAATHDAARAAALVAAPPARRFIGSLSKGA
jgi:hypothetical protein